KILYVWFDFLQTLSAISRRTFNILTCILLKILRYLTGTFNYLDPPSVEKGAVDILICILFEDRNHNNDLGGPRSTTATNLFCLDFESGLACWKYKQKCLQGTYCWRVLWNQS
ncbi:hypothetical protein MKW98_006147, partial [Papaver atlanticum]